jgi:hypothetical protein
MNQDFLTAGMDPDQPSINTSVSSEASNKPIITKNELVPEDRNDENGAQPSQEGAGVELIGDSHTCEDPRTAKGKTIANRNALKHGIFSNVILLTSDSRKRYNSLLSGLWEHFKPIGTIEEVLVEKLAVMIWRYRRLMATETAEIKQGANLLEGEWSISDSTILNRFPRYEASIERGFDRTLTQLERIQRMRLGQPVAPPVKVDLNISS